MHLEPLALRLFLRHGVEISNAFLDPKKVEEEKEENSEQEEEEDEQERERERKGNAGNVSQIAISECHGREARVHIYIYARARVRSLRYYSRVQIGRAASPAAAAWFALRIIQLCPFVRPRRLWNNARPRVSFFFLSARVYIHELRAHNHTRNCPGAVCALYRRNEIFRFFRRPETR